MKHAKICSLAIVALAAGLLPGTASAQLRITEVESSEAGGVHNDWWELTNLGLNPVNIGGYYFNDSDGGLITGLFAIPGGTTISAGESMIFVENAAPQTFRDWWGPSLGASVQIVTYSGSGLGLSSSGDQVNLWDSSSNVVDGVVFTAATAGTSFVFGNGAAGRLPSGLSQLGVNGAFAAAQNGDIGSPGTAVVPEPSVYALAGLSAAGMLTFRRRK